MKKIGLLLCLLGASAVAGKPKTIYKPADEWALDIRAIYPVQSARDPVFVRTWATGLAHTSDGARLEREIQSFEGGRFVTLPVRGDGACALYCLGLTADRFKAYLTEHRERLRVYLAEGALGYDTDVDKAAGEGGALAPHIIGQFWVDFDRDKALAGYAAHPTAIDTYIKRHLNSGVDFNKGYGGSLFELAVEMSGYAPTLHQQMGDDGLRVYHAFEAKPGQERIDILSRGGHFTRLLNEGDQAKLPAYRRLLGLPDLRPLPSKDWSFSFISNDGQTMISREPDGTIEIATGGASPSRGQDFLLDRIARVKGIRVTGQMTQGDFEAALRRAQFIL